MTNHDRVLYFHTSKIQKEVNDPYNSVRIVDAYNWFLEDQYGNTVHSAKERWTDRNACIINAIEEFGPNFWVNGDPEVPQDDWRDILNIDYMGVVGAYKPGLRVGMEEPPTDPREEEVIERPELYLEHGDSQCAHDSEMIVEVVQAVGDDEMMCRAARVSTIGVASMETEESAGLINFLMKGRHGSPFEHALFTFRITAPIVVWREFMRHRVGFSYNEQSGRYMELEAKSYLPDRERPLIQVGKPGAYTFERGDDEAFRFTIEQLSKAYDAAWAAYHALLDYGIAKEVARFALPVATYSTAYVTCNPRSLMHFLSLRTKEEAAKFPSYPQAEIEMVARKMEAYFKDLFPLTHAAFDANGRVSP